MTNITWPILAIWKAVLPLARPILLNMTPESDLNSSTNAAVLTSELSDSVLIAVISVVLGILILATVIGNVFVIGAILTERNLNTVNNYLVLSLAVADLMVACLVMPLSAVYEVTQEWMLGPELCDVWTSCDVLCCTASILHLLAIAIDRYWAVTNVDYARQRNAKRIYLMIGLIWIIAFVISFPPVFGWKDPNFWKRIETEKRCLVSQDIAYQVFATFSSFYVPLILILILYWRIYQEARKRIRRRPGAKAVLIVEKGAENVSHTSCCGGAGGGSSDNDGASTIAGVSTANGEEDVSVEKSELPSTGNNNLSSLSENGSAVHASVGRLLLLAKKEKKIRKESVESKRERKAAKTLAIITGVFVVCWLPFFVMALLMPLCPGCEPSMYLLSFLLWLGYANSLLNPIIYTIFSPDFRRAFTRILCGGRSTQRP